MTQDPVPCLNRKHFEEALQTVKKTSNPDLLARYEAFRRKYDPEYAKEGEGVEFRWPEDNNAKVFEQAQDEDDDDLY